MIVYSNRASRKCKGKFHNLLLYNTVFEKKETVNTKQSTFFIFAKY